MRDEKEFLYDIIEAIEAIQKYSQRGKEIFDKDELIQNWVVRHLQIIGEGAFKISKETQGNFPKVPWKKMIGMRHILVHGYFDIDSEIVWGVVEKQLDELKENILDMLKNYPNLLAKS